jgi:hypothetical protein
MRLRTTAQRSHTAGVAYTVYVCASRGTPAPLLVLSSHIRLVASAWLVVPPS